MSKSIFAIATASLCGGFLRYVVSTWFHSRGIADPYATLTINLAGALLLGIAITLAHTAAWQTAIRDGLCTGAIGSFTTFSSFSLDALHLLNTHPAVAVAYVGVSIGGGIGAFIAGRLLVLYWLASDQFPSTPRSTR